MLMKSFTSAHIQKITAVTFIKVPICMFLLGYDVKLTPGLVVCYSEIFVIDGA